MWRIAKTTGRSLDSELESVRDIPNTISLAIMLRMQYDSYSEFSEPIPEEYWDYPHLVRAHVERLYPGLRKTTTDISFDEISE